MGLIQPEPGCSTVVLLWMENSSSSAYEPHKLDSEPISLAHLSTSEIYSQIRVDKNVQFPGHATAFNLNHTIRLDKQTKAHRAPTPPCHAQVQARVQVRVQVQVPVRVQVQVQ